MATFSKEILSASIQGKAVKVATTATPGTLVHTTGISATVRDEIWLWAYNSHTADVPVTVEFGGAAAPDQNIVVTVPFKVGLVLLVPGLVLLGDGAAGLTVKVFAGTTNVITVNGHVNRIT